MAQYTYKLTSAGVKGFKVRVIDAWGDVVAIWHSSTPKEALERINADSMKYNEFPVFGK